MSRDENDRRVDYLEFPATDIEATKRFYADAFGWQFTDYGPEYTAFNDGKLDGGFTTGTPVSTVGPLVVLYAVDLDDAQKRIESAGGVIARPAYEFPGGRRFHFRDPNGNELAVWSET